MNRVHRFVEFTLEGQRYALPLAVVERIVHAVLVTKVPESPEIVLGLINMGGRMVPVINLRKRFGFRDREVSPNDRMILANTPRWRVVLWVDAVPGVFECSGSEVVPSGKVFPGMEGISGVMKMDGEIIQIYDLEKCLSLDDEGFLCAAIVNAEGAGKE